MEPEPHSLRDWESLVEKKLREAIERGDFDNLPGSGRPLDLEENPFTPPDLRLAFKVLQDAGFAPDWIEADKHIRRELTSLETLLNRQRNWERASRDRLSRLAPDRAAAERELLRLSREALWREYRSRAAELNRLIDIYNLKTPSARVHHLRLPIEQRLSALERELDALL